MPLMLLGHRLHTTVHSTPPWWEPGMSSRKPGPGSPCQVAERPGSSLRCVRSGPSEWHLVEGGPWSVSRRRWSQLPLSSTCWAPGTVAAALHLFTHLLLTSSLWCGCCYFQCKLRRRKTEQRLRSLREWARLDFSPAGWLQNTHF